MRIERLELFHVSVPLPATQRLASHPGHTQPANELTFVRMTTDDGIVGEAGGFTLGRFHAGLGDSFGKFILGRDPADIEGFQHVLEAGAAFGVRIAWLEPALWDILGKAAGLPVYRLLGSARSRMPAYCSTAELKSPEERAESLLARKAEGFTGAKLRAHSVDWRDDLRMIERAREAVGPDFKLLVDANQGFYWGIFPGGAPRWDVRTAIEFARGLDDLDIHWLEEPLERSDYDGHAELRRATRVRLAGGELTWRLQEYRELATRRCLDVLQTDAIFFGGIAGGRKVASLAEAHGLGFAPHCWSNGFSLIANLHVMSASPNCELCEFPYEPPAWVPEVRDALFVEPIRIDADGCVALPSGPGLGLRIDEDKLRKYGEKIYDGRA